jgi:hypothetical protein
LCGECDEYDVVGQEMVRGHSDQSLLAGHKVSAIHVQCHGETVRPDGSGSAVPFTGYVQAATV